MMLEAYKNIWKSTMYRFLIAFISVFISGCGIENKYEEYNHGKAIFISSAMKYVGVPYKLGGQGYDYMDCSGLIIKSLNDIGINNLYYDGNVVFDTTADGLYRFNSLETKTPKPGDLIFFDVENTGRMTHVSIFLTFTETSVVVLDAFSGSGRVEIREVEEFYSKNHVFCELDALK